MMDMRFERRKEPSLAFKRVSMHSHPTHDVEAVATTSEIISSLSDSSIERPPSSDLTSSLLPSNPLEEDSVDRGRIAFGTRTGSHYLERSLSKTSSTYQTSTTSLDITSSAPSSVTSAENLLSEVDTQAPLLRLNDRCLPCVFYFCDCSRSFDIEHFADWYSHSLSHFHDHPPPKQTICIFCDTIFTTDDPWRCWHERMYHIAQHLDNGEPIENSRPDFALLRYLRDLGIISRKEFNYAATYTERPYVDGLRPFGFSAADPKIRPCMVCYDLQKEERMRKGIKARSLQKVLRTIEFNHDLANQEPKTPTDLPKHVTIEKETIQDEADVFLLDRGLSSIEVNDLSDGSLDDHSSYFSDRTELVRQSLSADLERDDDLVDPMRHKQRLKNIREVAFHNSIALGFDYKLKSCFEGRRSDLTSSRYSECCEMLKKIRNNILNLQHHGFCQKQLSFLTIDPRRSNVALLEAIPIEAILRLGLAFEPSQVLDHLLLVRREQEQAAKLPCYNDYNTEEKESFNETRCSDNRSSTKASRIAECTSNILKTSSSQGSKTTGSRDVQSLYKSQAEYGARVKLLRVEEVYQPPQSPTSRHITVQHKLQEGWENFGRVSIARGSLVVHNHGQRRYDDNEPRSSNHRELEKMNGVRARTGRTNSIAHLRISVSKDFPEERPLWNTLAKECRALLRPVKIRTENQSAVSSVYTSLRILDLIILSYSAAHVEKIDDGPLRIGPSRNIFGIAGPKIYHSRDGLANYGGAIVLSYRKLRCVDGFLANRSVWVFHGQDMDPRDETTLFLSTSPENFADIWGPMWKIRDLEKSSDVHRYDLEHGSIVLSDLTRPPESSDILLEDDEALCHWISDFELRRREDSESFCQSLVTKPKLLIGAKKELRLEQNRKPCYCDASHITKRLRNGNYLRPLGTSRNRRRIDAEGVNIGLAGGITGLQANYLVTTKINLGRTFKESFIKRWSLDKKSRNPYVLLEYRATEMSFCTRHSRRIRLIDLLSTATISRLIGDHDPIKDPECKEAVIQSLRVDAETGRVDSKLLVNLYIDKHEWREEIANLIVCCMDALSDTGTPREPGEPMSLFWMFDHTEYILRFPQRYHRWSGFVKDSEDCSSFTVFEEKCLVVEFGLGCQHKIRLDALLDMEKECGPLFETALVVNDLLSGPTGLKLVKSKRAGGGRRWKVNEVEKGTIFPMGEQGSLQVVKVLSGSDLLVKWLPKNPFKAVLRDVLALVAQKDSELHHSEAIVDSAQGDDRPVRIFIVS